MRAPGAHEWRAVRAVRLAMLADPSDAFGHGPEVEAVLPEEHWRALAEEWASEDRALRVAQTPDGAWAGVMGCRLRAHGPELTWVWVDPAHRGGPVTDALLAAIEDWARQRGDALHLVVFTDVPRAVSAYLRRGFAVVGDPVPAGETGRHDWIMRKPL
ncbi:GNAT family N-acetyltransferase [Xylanimonas oleitrophica]|uniref:GNAT family N-acetyltransferase n=1 Tax=Xylanimonas oleitrophica TaxID=2607479 RepID=A0A2W5WR27_9MICO|nr:GNAT family N-acetyltransferase [Xylanimonas oleitrophica]PZR53777.1 GNAT family N-acetyltransferase [Xylanimonas oleitrophica]